MNEVTAAHVRQHPAKAAMTGECIRPAVATNDNDVTTHDFTLLEAALRHFARYGIGAAAEAKVNADKAHLAGDRGEYLRWVGICRTLDRRLAREIDGEMECA